MTNDTPSSTSYVALISDNPQRTVKTVATDQNSIVCILSTSWLHIYKCRAAGMLRGLCMTPVCPAQEEEVMISITDRHY